MEKTFKVNIIEDSKAAAMKVNPSFHSLALSVVQPALGISLLPCGFTMHMSFF